MSGILVRRSFFVLALCLSAASATILAPGIAAAQEPAPPAAAEGPAPNTDAQAKELADKAAQREKELLGDAGPAAAAPADEPPAPVEDQGTSLNLLDAYFKGGPLMHPILLMSFVVVVFSIERFLGLRRDRVVPEALVLGLGQLSNRKGGLDPRLAYRLCQKHRSTAANVIRAALLKVGRPHSEVEQAVAQASEREADILYKNVRPISLAISVTPLIGLLGTVLGMIEAFAITSQSAHGAKATQLAGGIYVALITTVGGLIVAIPAAVIAHYFEGRIQSVFRDVDDLLLSLLPQLERYEGKLRITRWEASGSSQELGEEGESQATPPAAETPRPTASKN